MNQMVIENLFLFAKYLAVCPLLGWAMMLCLFEILDALGMKYNKGHKVKCWVYFSLICVIFAILVKSFS